MKMLPEHIYCHMVKRSAELHIEPNDQNNAKQ